MARQAEAEWKGDLKGGSGRVKLGSGAYEGNYSFATRFENGSGANPEELVGAALAGCYSMALVNMLAQAGFTQVHNIVDGFEGDVVSDADSVFVGQRLKNGWKNSGCAWTYKLTPERLLLPQAQA